MSFDFRGSENCPSNIDYVKGTVRHAVLYTAIYTLRFELILAQVHVSGTGEYEKYRFAVVNAGAMYLRGN